MSRYSRKRSILTHGCVPTLLLCLAPPLLAQDAPPETITQPKANEETVNPLDPAILEADGATIGSITIVNRNIFDLSNPLENKWLYRTANKWHIVTKPKTVESQLLFKEGEPYALRLSDESERILRLNNYLKEADVEPVSYTDGVVDLEVTTQDIWTLTPELSLSRSGGQNEYGFGLLEHNLFGRGVQTGIAYESNVDRDSLFLEYTDTNFLRKRNRFRINYADNSDGFLHLFEFGKPFYALDRKRAARMLFTNGEQIDKLYSLGEIVAEFDNRYQYSEVSAGWSKGLRNGWVRRYTGGIVYTRNTFASVPDDTSPISILPDDREYLYPFIGMEIIQDQYETTANFDQLHVTEDRFIGTWINFRIGYSSKSTTSSANAWHYRAAYSKGLIATNKASWTLAANLAGRWQQDEAQNAELSAVSRFHYRVTDKQIFYARLSGTAGENLDIDNPLYLGGDTGLRGYPLRYQNGQSKFLLTLEQRYFTDWYPFRLAHVGGAIFFDAGRTWGESPVGAPQLGLLKDIGIGLRLGLTRASGAKVIHIDLAFPLDGEDDIDDVQILFSGKGSF